MKDLAELHKMFPAQLDYLGFAYQTSRTIKHIKVRVEEIKYPIVINIKDGSVASKLAGLLWSREVVWKQRKSQASLRSSECASAKIKEAMFYT